MGEMSGEENVEEVHDNIDERIKSIPGGGMNQYIGDPYPHMSFKRSLVPPMLRALPSGKRVSYLSPLTIENRTLGAVTVLPVLLQGLPCEISSRYCLRS